MAYQTTTRVQLRTALAARYTGDLFWTDEDANDAINEALRQFNLYTGFWRGETTALTVLGTPFVTLSASLTRASRVWVTGQRPLLRKSVVGLYRSRRTWRTETITDGGTVPTTIKVWAPIGLRQLAIWPQDAGGTTLTIAGVIATPVLTADADFVNIGDEEHGAILDEALWVLAFKRPSLLQAMEPRHQAFLRSCLLKNGQLRQSAAFRLALGTDQEQQLKPVRQPFSSEPGQVNEG